MTISTSYCKDLWNVNKYNTIQYNTQETPLVVNSVSKTMKFNFITGPPGSTPCILIMEGASRFRP